MARHRRGLAVSSASGVAMLGSVCPAGLHGTGNSNSGDHHQSAGASYAVAAQRQPLTTNAKSPVAHDTETEALVAHSGRLFAATGQWEYPGPSAFGQVSGQEVKDQSVDGLRADTVPSGPGAGLLSDSERSGSRAGAFPPRDPSDRRRAVEDPVVARRRQLLLPSQFVRSPRRRRRPCVSERTSRTGSGPSMPEFARLGSPGGLVTSSPHPGVQSQARAHWWPRQGRRVR